MIRKLLQQIFMIVIISVIKTSLVCHYSISGKSMLHVCAYSHVYYVVMTLLELLLCNGWVSASDLRMFSGDTICFQLLHMGNVAILCIIFQQYSCILLFYQHNNNIIIIMNSCAQIYVDSSENALWLIKCRKI